MNFTLSSEKLGEGADYVVYLGGEVDLYTAPELKQELHRLVAEGATRLVIENGSGSMSSPFGRDGRAAAAILRAGPSPAEV